VDTHPDRAHAEQPAAGTNALARQLSRRKFLSLAAGGGVLGAGLAALGPSAWLNVWEASAAAEAKKPSSKATLGSQTGRTLVLLTLYGGNDGLNTVIPYENPAYAAARGPLAIDPRTVLPLGDGYGLHPSMPKLAGLFKDSKLAIVQGVGFADPNYSHFESMDIWQTAIPSDPSGTGWLGRWLDATNSSPLRALNIGPVVPTALVGDRIQAAAIAPGPLVLPGSTGNQALYRDLAATSSHMPTLALEAAESCGDLLEVDRVLGPILDRDTGSSSSSSSSSASASASASAEASAGALAIANGGGQSSSGNVLATQLSVVANLILAEAPSEVYSVQLGGFDTHADQLATQQTLLGDLDSAVSAFLDAISSTKRGRDTIVLVYTEFGRRLAANASAGTDHGWANVAFVAGHSVKGGFFGDAPSLANLSEGNMIYTTDFRSLYATVLDQVIGVTPSRFLDGKFPQLAFV
jgi:uncharacterized protein (DUF1501 family)